MVKIINLVLNDFTNDSRVLKTSQSLQRMGHNVTVVAMHNTGLKTEEFVNGVEVHRIYLRSRAWSKNKIIQILKFMEFVARFVVHYRRSEVLHCNDLNALMVGVACKFFNKKIKIIYDSHEFAINDRPHQSPLSIRLHYWLENILIRFAICVINVSDSIANEYARLYKIEKPFLVLNCPEYKEQDRNDIFRKDFNIRVDQKIFLYQGGLSRGRGIEILLDAFATLPSDAAVLIFMGYGPLQALIQERASKSEKIFFHPAVNPDVLLNFTSSADYGILFYEDTCLNHRYCSPNKIFEYLMAGIPVLTSNLFEMKRLVLAEGVGIVAAENTIQGFRSAVMDLMEMPYATLCENVYSARKKYCWEMQEIVLQEVYGGL